MCRDSLSIKSWTLQTFRQSIILSWPFLRRSLSLDILDWWVYLRPSTYCSLSNKANIWDGSKFTTATPASGIHPLKSRPTFPSETVQEVKFWNEFKVEHFKGGWVIRYEAVTRALRRDRRLETEKKTRVVLRRAMVLFLSSFFALSCVLYWIKWVCLLDNTQEKNNMKKKNNGKYLGDDNGCHKWHYFVMWWEEKVGNVLEPGEHLQKEENRSGELLMGRGGDFGSGGEGWVLRNVKQESF